MFIILQSKSGGRAIVPVGSTTIRYDHQTKAYEVACGDVKFYLKDIELTDCLNTTFSTLAKAFKSLSTLEGVSPELTAQVTKPDRPRDLWIPTTDPSKQ